MSTIPTCFEEIKTNIRAKNALIDEFEEKDNRSRFFLSGPRGVGKKTMVKLFLKEKKYSQLIIDVNDYSFREDALVDLASSLKDNPKDVLRRWMCIVMTGFECGLTFDQKIYQIVIDKILKGLPNMPVIAICNGADKELLSAIKSNLRVDTLFATAATMNYMNRQEVSVFVKNCLKVINKNKLIIYNTGEIDALVATCKGTFEDCIKKVKRHTRNKKRGIADIIDNEDYLQSIVEEEEEEEEQSEWSKAMTELCKDKDKDNIDDACEIADILSFTDHHFLTTNDDKTSVKPSELLLTRMHEASVVSRRHSKLTVQQDIYMGFLVNEGLYKGLAKTVFIKDGLLSVFRKTLRLYGFENDSEYLLLNGTLAALFTQYDKHQAVVKKAEEIRQSKLLDDGYKRELYIERFVHDNSKKNNAVDTSAVAAVAAAVKEKEGTKKTVQKKRKIDNKQVTLDALLFKKKKI